MRLGRLARLLGLALTMVAGCSMLNREGPHETCATLDGGAVNACHDGIIAACLADRIDYEICDNASVCEEAWQRTGAFRCTKDGVAGGVDAGSVDAGGPSASECDAGCVVAPLPSEPSSLAVHGAELFYCLNDAAWKVSKTGGAPRRIGDVAGGCTSTIFVDDSDVWLRSAAAPAAVVSVPAVGGLASVSYEDTRGVVTFAIDQEAMYWIDGTAMVQRRAKKAFVTTPIGMGGPVTFRAAPMQVDSGRLVWISDKGLSSMPVTGGTVESVDLLEVPTSFVVTGGTMYWLGATRGILRTDMRSGATVPLASVDPSTRTIALASNFVYWADDTQIARVSKSGSGPETVASEGASLLVADDDGAYWYANGQLRRALR